MDHNPQNQPPFSCFKCFRGSHDCERVSLLHDTLSSLSTPTGFVWLCDKCLDEVDPIEPRKHKARHDSGAFSKSDLSDSANSSNTSNLALENALSSTQNPIHQTPAASASPPSANICKNFLNWNCPHGISGKKQIGGKCCPFTHNRVCNQFRISGSTGRKGCKKGTNCAFFHPDICKVALDKGLCTKKDCVKFHPRSTRKKKNESHQPNAPIKVKEKAAKQIVDVNSKSSDFLELRNLVAGMATKLEALEKRMSQGTLACHPTTQPISVPLQSSAPTMFSAPAPHSLMPLGVQRLPTHPMTYPHHSFY